MQAVFTHGSVSYMNSRLILNIGAKFSSFAWWMRACDGSVGPTTKPPSSSYLFVALQVIATILPIAWFWSQADDFSALHCLHIQFRAGVVLLAVDIPLNNRNDQHDCEGDNTVVHVVSRDRQCWWKDEKHRRQDGIENSNLCLSRQQKGIIRPPTPDLLRCKSNPKAPEARNTVCPGASSCLLDN
jgi:hypothetical protein